MNNLYVPTKIIIQLENTLEKPTYGAPVLVSGFNVVIDNTGKIKYEPVVVTRPVADTEFDENILSALNAKLEELNLMLIRKEEI